MTDHVSQTSGGPGDGRTGTPLAEWFDGFVGSEDERAVADALLALVGAAELIAAYHQSGGQEWWDAHSKLYKALKDLGTEAPYAS